LSRAAKHDVYVPNLSSITEKEVLPGVGVVAGGIEGGISSSVEVVRSVVAAGIEGGVSSSV
jgi:hypothetical protein